MAVKSTGWRIAQSLALELDIALGAMSGKIILDMVDEDTLSIINAVPSEWRSQWVDMLGERRSYLAILQVMAYFADVLFEDDYHKMSLAIRQMSLDDVMDKLQQKAMSVGISPDTDLDTEQQFINLACRYLLVDYTRIEFNQSFRDTLEKLLRIDLNEVVHILRDGERHIHFWHWIDQFYYGTYQAWRQQKNDDMAALETQAITLLGAKEQTEAPPNLQWLHPQNPLKTSPELKHAVSTGQMQVVFLTEPFGFTDLWAIFPHYLIVTYAENADMADRFLSFSEDLATRMKAFSDPTRMFILRLIRHFSYTNTEIADYLGLARPTVSVHAKILREAGLIRSHQEGRSMRHEIIPEAIRKTLQDVEKFLELPQEIDNNDEL